MRLYNPFRDYEAEKQQAVQEAAAFEHDRAMQMAEAKMESYAQDIALQLEHKGYERLYADLTTIDFSLDGLKRMWDISRAIYLQNPLIRRSIRLPLYYVWGLGYTLYSENKVMDDFIKRFTNDFKNKRLFGDVLAFKALDEEAYLTGNLFFGVFTGPTGITRYRLLNCESISDIIYNPDDAMEPWFYIRYVDNKPVAYPDMDLDPRSRESVESRVDLSKRYPDITFSWRMKVWHAKTGGAPRMKYGIPERYSSHPWAIGYKGYLEDYLSIQKSYKRVAFQMAASTDTTAAAIKSKVEAKVPNQGSLTSPGSWLIGNAELKAVRTSGATSPAEEGHPVKSMMAAGSDIPGHFFGDADVGSMATATTLDRPTELMITMRQVMWGAIMSKLIGYAFIQEVILGNITGADDMLSLTYDPTEDIFVFSLVPDVTVSMDFPSILERNADERLRAVVGALTLNGRPANGIINDKRFALYLILEGLGYEPAKIDALVDKMYPGDEPVVLDDMNVILAELNKKEPPAEEEDADKTH